jgi:hypothetical protein
VPRIPLPPEAIELASPRPMFMFHKEKLKTLTLIFRFIWPLVPVDSIVQYHWFVPS